MWLSLPMGGTGTGGWKAMWEELGGSGKSLGKPTPAHESQMWLSNIQPINCNWLCCCTSFLHLAKPSEAAAGVRSASKVDHNLTFGTKKVVSDDSWLALNLFLSTICLSCFLLKVTDNPAWGPLLNAVTLLLLSCLLYQEAPVEAQAGSINAKEAAKFTIFFCFRLQM